MQVVLPRAPPRRSVDDVMIRGQAKLQMLACALQHSLPLPGSCHTRISLLSISLLIDCRPPAPDAGDTVLDDPYEWIGNDEELAIALDASMAIWLPVIYKLWGNAVSICASSSVLALQMRLVCLVRAVHSVWGQVRICA